MQWYQYLSLLSAVVCLTACIWHFYRLVRLGNPKDLSKKSGSIAKAEVYAYTTSMLPTHKESASKHIPTYTAGIFFHIGTFISLLYFVLSFFFEPMIFRSKLIFAIILLLVLMALVLGIISGIGLFLKRLFSKKLRALSSLDDYLSNFLTTFFQIVTACYLFFGMDVAPYYYIAASLLLLYLPVGKLRHAVYFFAARYQLGLFYGRRNVWPPQKEKEDNE